MTVKLKPCPFCGGAASLVHTSDDDWYVACDNSAIYECGCLPATWICSTKEEAVELWNRRAKDD